MGPIEVDTDDFKCVNDSNPNQHFTTPILGGNMPSSTTARFGLTGNNVYNVYRADGTGLFHTSPVKSGSLKFGVTPCAEKIDIAVKGANDPYIDPSPPAQGNDNLEIKIDDVVVKNYAGSNSQPVLFPFNATTIVNETFTHNFTAPKVCGHIVEISGASGTFYNAGGGYDVGLTVTLRTTQLPT